jgi:hypothetical protein
MKMRIYICQQSLALPDREINLHLGDQFYVNNNATSLAVFKTEEQTQGINVKVTPMELLRAVDNSQFILTELITETTGKL